MKTLNMDIINKVKEFIDSIDVRLSVTTLIFLLPYFYASAKPQECRQRLTFDQNWQFKLVENKEAGTQKKTRVTDDTEPEQAQVTASEITNGNSGKQAFDKDFRNVTIPHDYSIEQDFQPQIGGSAGYLPGGLGIYQKEFVLPDSLRNYKKISITFDGVYHRATVYLNGQKLGYHMYGYTGFSFDMTPYVNREGKNVLRVEVNREEQSRWYTGSGIYRHVWLEATGSTHIRNNGVYVVANNSGNVKIETTISGTEASKLEHIIFDAKGKKVSSITSEINEESISTISTTVKSPKLWSVDTPNMYKVCTYLYNGKGKIIDKVTTPFGFRDIYFDADKGFFLNGKNMKIKGMCLHMDAGSLGVAVPDEEWERKIRTLKYIGCNAIRCSHNPPSPEFLTICDTMGVMVLDEAFDKWKSGYYEPFYDDNAHQDITDMIIRDRNHPSVIIWSIGNELSEAWLKDDTGVLRAKELNSIVKSLDNTRPTLVACQQGFEDKFGEVTDLVGYNYLEPRMISDHKRHPQRKMLVTEAFVYYSGMREDVVRDFVEENPWNFVKNNDFIAGSFVWAGVDYLGESSPWPAKGWCSCPFDITLKERPQAAFYHPAWNPEKDFLKLMVRDNCFDQAIGTDHWQYPPMADTWDLPYTDSRCVEVRCYTTCDSVQFFFPMWSNPQLPLKPRKTSDFTDNCIKIQLPARKGKVLAIGYKDGKPIMRDSLINHGVVANVRLEADNKVLTKVAKDYSPCNARNTVSNIRLTLVDKDGLVQQMESRRFKVETTGGIRLLGVETGDMRREQSWRTTSMKTYFGEGFIRIQSTAESNTGQVIVHVEGFNNPFILDF